MRRASSILLVTVTLATVALGACTTNVAQPEQRTANQERNLHRALDGKVAQKPVDCLPSFRQADMEIIDDHTLLFHDGTNRVYVQSPSGGCSPIGSGHYTLVTNIRGGSGSLCRGDISRVVDLSAGMTVGSCAMESFVPYVKPKG